ncbi:endonuclease/exonuclease/phosphatase family protein [Larkinella soli]|uniref:endonuclease/exonuclease/phosphatase family protein n=1 Tax=Larkinella soli TaxID=1770527 RepID=UPI000FFC05DB|nr:endonuclease/exonuclease/phosphatase family protein [Larkinella soli]
MNAIDNALLIYALVVTTLSFIHLIRVDYWWVRMWDFPHFQLAVLAGIGMAAWLALSRNTDWPVVLAPVGLLASLAYEGWLIYPFTPLHRKQVKYQKKKARTEDADANTIRILTANVYMENTHTPDVLALVKKYDPDVFMILEGNAAWQKALEPLEDRYPHRILHPLENTYGMLFYSRVELLEHEVRFLIQDDIPSIRAVLKLASGQKITFYGVHPMPPSPTEHYRSTERDAELLVVGKEVRKLTGPVIVAGDLNDVAWSHTTRLFQRVSGLLDPRIGRGLFNTFHARYFFMRWPLDHIFVSPHFQIRELRKLPNCGSDHFPIMITLTYAPEKRTDSEELPQPEKDDIVETEKIIDKAETEPGTAAQKTSV